MLLVNAYELAHLYFGFGQNMKFLCMLQNLVFTYKNEIRMMTGNQKRTGILCSRCSIKQVYSAHKVTEWMKINDVSGCASVAMNNIQGYINRWKGSLNQVLERSLYLNGYIWIYLGILVQSIYYNTAIQAAITVKHERLHQKKRWFNTVLLSSWAVLKNNFIYMRITVI